jgi:hypothetical protein
MLPVCAHFDHLKNNSVTLNPRAIMRANTSIILVLEANPVNFCAYFLHPNDKCKHSGQLDGYRSPDRAILFAKLSISLVLVEKQCVFGFTFCKGLSTKKPTELNDQLNGLGVYRDDNICDRENKIDDTS